MRSQILGMRVFGNLLYIKKNQTKLTLAIVTQNSIPANSLLATVTVAPKIVRTFMILRNTDGYSLIKSKLST